MLGGAPAVTLHKDFRWPLIAEETIQAVGELLRSGDISDTPYSELLRLPEEDWAAYLGVGFALARVDGTAALHSALFAAGVGAGEEVIVQSYTWIATVSTILAANAIPVFADIDAQTLTLDPAYTFVAIASLVYVDGLTGIILETGPVLAVLVLAGSGLLLRSGEDSAREQAFFQRLAAPRPVSSSSQQLPSALGVIGSFTLLIGALVTLLIAFPQSTMNRVVMLFAALVLLGSGWWMKRQARG